MSCKSDLGYYITWFGRNHDATKRQQLFDGYDLISNAMDYCTIIEDEPGKYYLNLTNNPKAAQTYSCLEPGTFEEASADVIWLGNSTGNTVGPYNSTDDIVNLTCSVDFRGNWAPTIEWREYSNDVEKVISAGYNTIVIPNVRVSSTLVTSIRDGGFQKLYAL